MSYIYELTPDNGRKSFYGKAQVLFDDNGDRILFSYDTKIMKITAAGEMVRFWQGWSATTGRHIAAFSGLNKKQYQALNLA